MFDLTYSAVLARGTLRVDWDKTIPEVLAEVMINKIRYPASSIIRVEMSKQG